MEAELQQALALARQAFPKLSGWQAELVDEFRRQEISVWGVAVFEEESFNPRRFFVTLNTFEGKWRGALTIGKHAYLWTEADCGDAYLVQTAPQDSIESAIVELSREIAVLFQTFSMSRDPTSAAD